MKTVINPSHIAYIPLLLFMYGCGGRDTKPAQGPMVTPVATYKVELGQTTAYDEYPATVRPLKEVEIRAMASGYITGIYFQDGQSIRKGQKLYQVDQQQIQASVDQAQANLRVAEANQRLAEKDAQRYLELDKNEAIAKQVLDNALARLETAKLQVRAARATVQQSRSGLKYTTVYAPISGTIGITQVQLGALVTSNQTLLNTLSQDSPMAVDFALEQKDIIRFNRILKEGARQDSTFMLTLPDGSLYPFLGTIELLDRAVDTQTGTIRTRLIFPNPGGMLIAGMTANVRVRTDESGPSLLIPKKALVEQMGEYFVYVVSGDSVTQQRVETGATVNGRVVIRKGLEENTEVVTEGIQKLKNGSKVKIVPATNPVAR